LKPDEEERMQRFALDFATLSLEAVKVDDDPDPSGAARAAVDVDAVNESKEEDLLRIEEPRSVCDRLSLPSRFTYMRRKNFMTPDTDVLFGRKSYFQFLQLLVTVSSHVSLASVTVECLSLEPLVWARVLLAGWL